MKQEISLPVIGAVIILVIIVVGIIGFMALRTPGPKTPLNKLPVPRNPYTSRSQQTPAPQ